jgi:diguanylate cyclase (GGDEF)-like protein
MAPAEIAMLLDWDPLLASLIAFAAVIAIIALTVSYLRMKEASRRDDAILRECATAKSELAALRLGLDQVAFGVVLLDSERRAQFINRAFRRVWRLPDDSADSRPSILDLMYHGRDARAYAVPPHQLGAYVAEQMALIRSGDERPFDLRLANGEVLRFRCTALPDGGCLLSYGDVSDLIHQADKLAQLASVDGLSGLYNRRHFLELAEIEWERFKRYERPLALLILDIDKFKSINDRYGHDVGDLVIKTVAEVLRETSRTSDITARVGGEEFALLLPETNLENACLAAGRFWCAVAERTISIGDQNLSVTVSVGLSSAGTGMSGIPELMKQADLGLYEAKRTGRNRVCAYSPAIANNQATSAA